MDKNLIKKYMDKGENDNENDDDNDTTEKSKNIVKLPAIKSATANTADKNKKKPSASITFGEHTKSEAEQLELPQDVEERVRRQRVCDLGFGVK